MGEIIILIVVIAFFVLCRELVCWYWKINETVTKQQKTIDSLTDIICRLDQINVNSQHLKRLDDISRKIDEIVKNQNKQ